MKSPIYLLDGYSLIYRTYFAFISKPLVNSTGKNVSVIHGFFNSMLSFFSHYKPEQFAVILDSPVPTFRHKQYPDYKANREKAPQDLHDQIPDVIRILKEMNIPSLAVPEYEADDIIATIARNCSKNKQECFILSGDKDLMQLVDDYVTVLKPDKGSYIKMDREKVLDTWGLPPEKILELLSLTGDTADNIPGVKGIGPKTALKLLNAYETLENIFKHTDECTPSEQKKLEAGEEAAFLSRDLIALCYDTPIPGDFYESLEIAFTLENAAGEFRRLEVNGIADQLNTEQQLELIPAEEQVRGSYEAVLTEGDLNKWIILIKEKGVFSFDVETDNIDEMYANPVGFSLSVESGKACYIPLKAEGADCLSAETIKAALKQILTDSGLKLIGQNIKYDYKVCKRWGIEITNIYFDTMIAAWILDALRNVYNMDSLARDYLNYLTIHFEDVVEKGQTFDTAEFSKAVDYAAEDSDVTFRLYEYFSEQLKERDLEKIFFDLEMPLVKIIADMELNGIQLEGSELLEYGKEVEIELAGIQKEIYSECGKEFNINSTKQLQEVLFVDRGLTPVKKTKTGYSTNVQVLEELSRIDAVPALILKHRSLSKLKSTYLDTLPELVNPDTGRIHSRFIQTGTATGRLSSKDPNLQNIPVKDEAGRRIRMAFRPADGYSFISADYSQIELVILAHLSGDPGLTSAFKAGGDVHRSTGAKIFQKPEDEVSAEDRRIAKTINFGVMYGMSSFRLSQELHIPMKQAKQFIDSYFATYSGIKGYIDTVIAETEKSGFVRTMAGRERKIPGINSRNKTEKKASERVSINTPIQGSAADIVKMAMISLSKAIENSKLPIKMIVQIHDELVFEVKDEFVTQAQELIKTKMKKAAELSLELNVSIDAGKSWGAIH